MEYHQVSRLIFTTYYTLLFIFNSKLVIETIITLLDNIPNLISVFCGILKMVGPKKQDFWPKINILKGNHCILMIGGAPVRQKLGMILENKVVQKLKLEKNVFFQK